jgi:serine carboxypeptidase 1
MRASNMHIHHSHVLQEVGPYDVGWRPRKHSWVQKAHVLFVDNPVGTGFSYIRDGANFTSNNAEIGADLLVFLKGFMNTKPEVRRAFSSMSVTGWLACSFQIPVVSVKRVCHVVFSSKQGVWLTVALVLHVSFGTYRCT